MKPFDLKKLSERRVELMARLEGMVSTCQMETRAFNEEERASYSKILDEVRSIDATLDAAEQGQALSQVERRAAAAGHLGRRRFRSRLLLLLRLLIPGRDGVLRVHRSYLFLLGLLLLIRGQRVGQHGGGQQADDHHDGQQPAYDSLLHVSFSFM